MFCGGVLLALCDPMAAKRVYQALRGQPAAFLLEYFFALSWKSLSVLPLHSSAFTSRMRMWYVGALSSADDWSCRLLSEQEYCKFCTMLKQRLNKVISQGSLEFGVIATCPSPLCKLENGDHLHFLINELDLTQSIATKAWKLLNGRNKSYIEPTFRNELSIHCHLE